MEFNSIFVCGIVDILFGGIKTARHLPSWQYTKDRFRGIRRAKPMWLLCKYLNSSNIAEATRLHSVFPSDGGRVLRLFSLGVVGRLIEQAYV
jgi:hypothetical protein